MTKPEIANVAASWGANGGAWAVLVHGGAGDLASDPAGEPIAGARLAAQAAAKVLRSGGSALDAVERAVLSLEDDPCFNAGTGACLNVEGLVELDAALMEGAALRAGGVCAMPPFLHPIAIARAVLEDGRHTLYAAEGAERFARQHGFARVTSEALTTAAARARWVASQEGRPGEESRGGTVGAVARDVRGTVAAATSTGGLANKRPGRVGDSPLLGAGTYADDDSGACSATGAGEAIMRLSLAKTATDALRGRFHPEDAARAAVRVLATRVGGTGGVILVDRYGRLGLARNTSSMVWAAVGETLDDTSGA
jgi:beta-aspartyl-peptidase (threonine type)